MEEEQFPKESGILLTEERGAMGIVNGNVKTSSLVCDLPYVETSK